MALKAYEINDGAGNRRAVVRMTLGELAVAARLPEGVLPVVVYTDVPGSMAYLVVECDDFPEQRRDCHLPSVSFGDVTVESVEIDGKVFKHVTPAVPAQDVIAGIPAPKF